MDGIRRGQPKEQMAQVVAQQQQQQAQTSRDEALRNPLSANTPQQTWAQLAAGQLPRDMRNVQGSGSSIDTDAYYSLLQKSAQQQYGQEAFLRAMLPQQAAFAQQLGAQATGQALSPATQLALQQNQAAQIGMMRSMRGGNQALAQRNIAQNAQQAQQQAMLAGTAQAQGMYGNYLGQQQQYNLGLMGAQQQATQGLVGSQLTNEAQRAQSSAASTAANNQLAGSLIGAAGAGLGMYFGGPAAAAAGAAAAKGTGANPYNLSAGLQMPTNPYLGTEVQRQAHGGMIQPGSHYTNYFSTMMNGGQVQGMNMGGTTDSLKNDTVPTMLSPGEIVIPKSVVNGPNPKANAAKFVEAILAKQGMRK